MNLEIVFENFLNNIFIISLYSGRVYTLQSVNYAGAAYLNDINFICSLTVTLKPQLD